MTIRPCCFFPRTTVCLSRHRSPAFKGEGPKHGLNINVELPHMHLTPTLLPLGYPFLYRQRINSKPDFVLHFAGFDSRKNRPARRYSAYRRRFRRRTYRNQWTLQKKIFAMTGLFRYSGADQSGRARPRCCGAYRKTLVAAPDLSEEDVEFSIYIERPVGVFFSSAIGMF